MRCFMLWHEDVFKVNYPQDLREMFLYRVWVRSAFSRTRDECRKQGDKANKYSRPLESHWLGYPCDLVRLS